MDDLKECTSLKWKEEGIDANNVQGGLTESKKRVMQAQWSLVQRRGCVKIEDS